MKRSKQLFLRQKEKLDKRGSSMILVIVAIAFIGLLSALLLNITLTNVQMKVADKESKKNFYNDETIVNEVTSILEDYSSESMEYAYTWLVQNYSAESTDTKARQETFSKKYMAKLSWIIGGKTGTYDDSILTTTYQAAMLKDDYIRNNSSSISISGASKSQTGTIVHSTETDALGATNYTYEYLTLKNVVITYKDEQDYETTITTDINMELPASGGGDTSFAKYALISDQLIKVTSTNTVSGGVYAGNTDSQIISGGNDAVNPNYGGIWVDGVSGSLTIDGKNANVVTRQSLIVSDLGKLSITNASVWAKNIVTIGSSGSDYSHASTILLDAVTKVEDDLAIKADYSNITLKGEYYGFSYKNTDEDAKSSASTSSSVQVNAENVQLNLDNINKFVLMGNSFISSKQGDSTMDGFSGIMDDILMGQSVAVKGDQGMYLVPTDSCLKISSNPITLDALNAYAKKEYGNSADYQSLDLKTDIVNFNKGAQKVIYENYLDKTTPLKAIYYKQGTGNNAVPMINYYYNFKSTEAANNYVAYYYSNNKSDLLKNFSKYFGGTLFTLNSDFTRFDVAGRVLVKEGSDVVLENAASSDMTAESQKYATQYKSVQLNLRVGGDTSKDLDSNPVVDSIVNLVNVNNMEDETNTILASADGTINVIVTRADSYTITESSSKGIIIASGDVHLGSNIRFEGVIIADGIIYLDNEGTFVANESLVVNALDYCYEHQNSLSDYLYLYDSVSSNRVGDDSMDYESAISFENWKKN